MITLVSTSLNKASKSNQLINFLADVFTSSGTAHRVVDLRSFALPICDGDSAYGDPEVERLEQALAGSTAIIVGLPVYNYTMGGAAKALLELAGSAFADKVVGVVAAAGGSRSYMAPLSLMNSLMLDFRSFVIPKYVYATPDDFTSEGIPTAALGTRLRELAMTVQVVSSALDSIDPVEGAIAA